LEHVCRTAAIAVERVACIARATGRVLEVGVGSGLNIPLFDPRAVVDVVGVDPSPRLELDRCPTKRSSPSSERGFLHRGERSSIPNV